MHALPVKHRRDSDLFVKFHGIEFDLNNNVVAVLEQADGEARLVSQHEVAHIRSYYLNESYRDPNLTPARRAQLADEDVVLQETGILLTNAYTMRWAPTTRPSRPSEEFQPVAQSYPPAIEQKAAAVIARYTLPKATP